MSIQTQLKAFTEHSLQTRETIKASVSMHHCSLV